MTGGTQWARETFGPMEGEQIPGGCEHCLAYQTVEPVVEGVWAMTVHHEDECPWWRERQRRVAWANRRRKMGLG